MDVTNDSIGQSAEGKIIDFLPESGIRTEELKTFDFDSKRQLITTEYPEFSAVCPFSGLPDIATLTIKYRPTTGKVIELKSLKYYLTSFRNVGIYQEGVTKRIYNDLIDVLELKSKLKSSSLETAIKAGDMIEIPIAIQFYVKTLYNVRGGFSTTCEEGWIEE